MSDPPQSDLPEPAIHRSPWLGDQFTVDPADLVRTAGAAMKAMSGAFEPFQQTMNLRFRLGVLEQCWRSPDGREDWRAVPVVLYDGAAPQGR